jgi:hypothetical protein
MCWIAQCQKILIAAVLSILFPPIDVGKCFKIADGVLVLKQRKGVWN